MSKCMKGCLPECQYFTTGGCVSPFNCAYKIEEYNQNNVFTSGDTNALSGIEKFFINTVKSGVLPQEPMNYDGAAMKAYISYLESENAELKARLDKAVELPCKVGDTVYKVYGECNGSDCPYNGAFGQWRCNYKGKDRCKAFIDTRTFRYSDISSINKTIFVSKEAAESRLAELKGEK